MLLRQLYTYISIHSTSTATVYAGVWLTTEYMYGFKHSGKLTQRVDIMGQFQFGFNIRYVLEIVYALNTSTQQQTTHDV